MDELLVVRRGGVRVLTLNRPDRLNAFTKPLLSVLMAALGDAEADQDCRAVLLHGAGRAFCAGQDLTMVEPGADLGDSLDRSFNPLIRRLRAMRLPVVCAVHGVAAGAGANLALACDIVLAGASARFIQSFIRIGLIPDAGGTWTLPRLAGDARARGMAMLVGPLKLQGIIAGFNGGAYVNPDQSVVLSRTLDPAAARRAYDAIRDHGLDAWVYTAEDWTIRDPAAPHVEREAHTVQFGPKVVADPAEGLDRAVKIVGVSDDLALVERCEADVQQAVKDQASAARSQPYYLDVTHRDANKGFVADTLSARLGIPTDQIATIGDMPNDVLMFRPSGLSIAMGQASQAVRDAAMHVTDGYNDEGFAKAVDRFIFDDPA